VVIEDILDLSVVILVIDVILPVLKQFIKEIGR
jgi:hypothetical protein